MENDLYTFFARQLADCRNRREAIEPITIKHPNLTLHDAYQIQKAGILLRETHGEKRVGYKMGLTSHAKQQQMQVSQPILGVLTDRMEINTEHSFAAKKLIHPKVEPEIAFILGKDLKGNVTLDEALAACSGICAALDVIDSRYIDFKFTLVDVVADNCSAGAYVLGPIKKATDFDLANLSLSLIENNVIIKQGNSNAILNNPINSLIMLAKLLAAENDYIKAGSIVLSGSATDAVTIKPGLRIANEVKGLGTAEFVSL